MWPPVEEGVFAQHFWIGIEVSAWLFDDGLPVGQALEVPVDDGFIDEAPQMLGRLEFGGVGWQVDEPQPLGHAQTGLGVPACPVEQKDDGALGSGTGLAGKQRQQALEQPLGNAVSNIPVAFAGGGRDKGCDVEPLVAVMAERRGPLPARRPDPAVDWLQPDAVLVGAEEANRSAGMARFFGSQRGGEFFLKASCSCALAAAGFFGRGAWIDQPIA